MRYLTFFPKNWLARLLISFVVFVAHVWNFQLCLVEQELFGAISVREFIDQSWARKQKEMKAPNVLAYIENFNKVYPSSELLQFLCLLRI